MGFLDDTFGHVEEEPTDVVDEHGDRVDGGADRAEDLR
jgi:hypothetical protein